jgi:hypothetical protein
MRTFPTLLAAAALTVALPLTASGPAVPASAPAPPLPAGATPYDPDDPTTWQTSDQVPGAVAAPATRGRNLRKDKTRRLGFRLSPGAVVRAWDETSTRGPARYYLIRMKWPRRGLRADYLKAGRVQAQRKVQAMVKRQRRAIAGVNGDFFDIGDTGAPLGIGKGRGKHKRQGIDYGWNAAFYVPRKGAPQIGTVGLRARVKGGARFPLTNYNSPQVKPGGIGVYDQRWGDASGFRWTDGQRKNVRMVRIKRGVVVSNRARRFPSGNQVTGMFLIARGAEPSQQLKRLSKGTRLTVRHKLEGRPRMAITGNRILLRDGRVQVSDDSEMHPRTAIGIDRDSKRLMFFVVDGRQEFSRGFTMRELAWKMKHLGAEDALNLDGGGSSTMVVRRNGRLRVLNSPSDGGQRRVPNGISIRYR